MSTDTRTYSEKARDRACYGKGFKDGAFIAGFIGLGIGALLVGVLSWVLA